MCQKCEYILEWEVKGNCAKGMKDSAPLLDPRKKFCLLNPIEMLDFMTVRAEDCSHVTERDSAAQCEPSLPGVQLTQCSHERATGEQSH